MIKKQQYVENNEAFINWCLLKNVQLQSIFSKPFKNFQRYRSYALT